MEEMMLLFGRSSMTAVGVQNDINLILRASNRRLRTNDYYEIDRSDYGIHL